MSSPLQSPLFERPNRKDGDLIVELGRLIWGLTLTPGSKEAKFYSEAYHAKIVLIQHSLLRCACHKDIVSIVDILQQNISKTLKQLQTEILSANPPPAWLHVASEEAAREALHFAASLWLMLSISATSGWSDDQTLTAFVKTVVFPPSNLSLTEHPIQKFSTSAERLNKIADAKIIWTDDLRQHLVYHPRARHIFIFRHATFLRQREHQGYPDDILFEASRTLALLFPYGEAADGRWNRRIRKKADPDVEAGISCGVSQTLQDYSRWGERLHVLQNAFDESKPRGLKQWFWDKRDTNQFYTFWIAVLAIFLTLLFGLVQSITGILQVINRS